MPGNAPRDENFVPTALFEVDGQPGVVMPGQIDSVTGRILVNGSGGGGGTVDTVVGTLNRITVNSADPANPIVDISSSYVGQISITTLGTITIGVWTGTNIALANGGTGTTLADPGADRIMFWDDSAGFVTWLEVGSGLSITGTTLTATGGGTGTVTNVSVVSANGFAGTVATATTTPAITLTTSINAPVLAGNGTAISAATTTGTGSTVVLNTSPTLVTPILGTPTSGTLTNCTGYTVANLSGLGTGVATALAVNTGLAGAVVLFNGALGTPSSGTVTNLTGTASININGTVGATTPTTATFTTATINTVLNPDTDGGAGLGSASLGFSILGLSSGSTINWNNGNMLLTHSAGILTISNTAAGALGPIVELYQDSASPAISDITARLDFYGRDSANNKQQYGYIANRIVSPTSTFEESEIQFAVNAGNSTPANRLLLTGASATARLTPALNDGTALGSTTLSFSDLFLAEGAVINWDNGDATLTQTGNDVTLAGASLTARVKPRVGTTTSSATPTINTDDVDYYSLTAQTADITSFTTNLSGTPTDNQRLWISITGTATRAITWGASFEASTVALPTTTVTTARLDVGFVWNVATSKWRCVASA